MPEKLNLALTYHKRMGQEKRVQEKTKSGFHLRNKHRERYDFEQLIKTSPELDAYVRPNKYGDKSIDFASPDAVKALNSALLKHHYGIEYWSIPKGYLCPPIPGRADYMHHIADLLADSNKRIIPRGANIRVLDIGVGANCIFPILGNREYGWSFVGTDIDPNAITSASEIVEKNAVLTQNVECILQTDQLSFFKGIIENDVYFDFTVCNPPFHSSAKEARESTMRKTRNLKLKKKSRLNFGGKSAELWCEGGERQFVRSMIYESKKFATSCFWFTTLVSKQTNLKAIHEALSIVSAIDVKEIQMQQGNKVSRIIAWTFLTEKQRSIWAESKWRR